MRILRGLSSRFLPCGCLVGVYETYSAEVVAIIDVRGKLCPDEAHVPNAPVALPETTDTTGPVPEQGVAERCHRET